MTDAPAATAPLPDVPAAAQTPQSYIGPLVAIITQLSPVISTVAANSGDVKTILTNLNAAWALPWIFWISVASGVFASLVWLYRRALSLRHPFALWWFRMMPWNRA